MLSFLLILFTTLFEYAFLPSHHTLIIGRKTDVVVIVIYQVAVQKFFVHLI